MSEISCDLAVVGAGPGGYAAAFLAADLGMRVALVDPSPNPGGVCLHRGCIPSKAFLHAARVLDESRAAAEMGIEFDPPRVAVDRLREWKDGVVEKLTGGLGQLVARRGIEYVQGRGVFRDAQTLGVSLVAGGESTIRFTNAILATGSVPAPVPGIETGSRNVVDSTGALELVSVPDRLLVVGGGYIGLELGQVYAALGSRVTIVEMTDGLLPGADRDLVKGIAARAGNRFEAIALNTRVASVDEGKDGVAVILEGPEGAEKTSFDRVLVSVGRRPVTAGLGLENTRARVGKAGFVETDAQRRTAEPSVFAVGDVAGQPMLAHKASHEARAAVEAIAGRKAIFEPLAIPAVVFTDPEIAWCGLGESEAKRAGADVAVSRFPWAASGRAATLGRSDGVTKLIIDRASQRVLGVGIAGQGAGELIAEAVLAVEMGATADDLRLTIHPHPTLSETLMESADVFFGQSTHLYRPRRSD